ncbi:hypothetical protein AYI68_g7957 [Smittium mucronatum]|uniref:Uncharacterized protein n=1 Tax=Smittium mucronatum TaxID=133383 RepID=A0A1R0GM79_9FUNG|nr:hypothetical protein AYI68_g7957 [Smittium mucronatum]
MLQDNKPIDICSSAVSAPASVVVKKKKAYKPPKTRLRKISNSIRNAFVNPPFYNYSGVSYLKNITYPPPPPYWSGSEPPPYDVSMQIGVIAAPSRLENTISHQQL